MTAGEAAAHAEHEAEWDALDEYLRQVTRFPHLTERHREWADMVQRVRRNAAFLCQRYDESVRDIQAGCEAHKANVDKELARLQRELAAANALLAALGGNK